jgi:hypothetical protein
MNGFGLITKNASQILGEFFADNLVREIDENELS